MAVILKCWGMEERTSTLKMVITVEISSILKHVPNYLCPLTLQLQREGAKYGASFGTALQSRSHMPTTTRSCRRLSTGSSAGSTSSTSRCFGRSRAAVMACGADRRLELLPRYQGAEAVAGMSWWALRASERPARSSSDRQRPRFAPSFVPKGRHCQAR